MKPFAIARRQCRWERRRSLFGEGVVCVSEPEQIAQAWESRRAGLMAPAAQTRDANVRCERAISGARGYFGDRRAQVARVFVEQIRRSRGIRAKRNKSGVFHIAV